jgi:outer membrane protein
LQAKKGWNTLKKSIDHYNISAMTKAFLSVIVLVLMTGMIQAQKPDSTVFLSLQQARDFAMENSPVIKNANLDLKTAQKTIWETTSIGLPQVSAKFSYSYMITLSSTIEKFNAFSSIGSNFGDIYGMLGALGAQTGNMYVLNKLDSISNANAGTSTETTSNNDLRWGLTLDITASQIIFSGTYLVGLQAAKVYKSLSEASVTKSIYDIKQNVSSAYYLVLIADENIKVLDSTYQNTSNLLGEITKMQNTGFLEETDIDQLKITLGIITNNLDMLKRQREIAKNLLKFQIGMDLKQPVELTDNLNSVIEEDKLSGLILQPFEVTNCPDYKIMEINEHLSKINVKLNQAAFLPDIAAYYVHQENFNDKSFSFTPPDLIGVGMNIPIFSSWNKRTKIAKAKILADKTLIGLQTTEQGLLLDFEKSKGELMTAYDKYNTNRENNRLAKKIYDRTVIKFKEGVAGSLDLTQAQNQYLTTETNYYLSLMDLLNAKAKIEKLLTK